MNSRLPLPLAEPAAPWDEHHTTTNLQLDITLHIKRLPPIQPLDQARPLDRPSRRKAKIQKNQLVPTLSFTISSNQATWPASVDPAHFQPLQIHHPWRNNLELLHVGMLYITTVLPTHCTINFQTGRSGEKFLSGGSNIEGLWRTIHESSPESYALNKHRLNYADQNIIGPPSAIKALLQHKQIRSTVDWAGKAHLPFQLPVPTEIQVFNPATTQDCSPYLPWDLEHFPGAPAFYIRDRTTGLALLSNLKFAARTQLQQTHRQILTTPKYKALRWLEEVRLPPAEARELFNRSRRDQKNIALMHAGANKGAYRARLLLETLDDTDKTMGDELTDDRHTCPQCRQEI